MMPRQTVTILKAHEIDPSLDLIWRDIQAAAPVFQSPYYHPTYTRIVSAVRDDVRIAIVEQGPEITAIFPFHLGAAHDAISIGCHLTDYQGPIARNSFSSDSSKFMKACGIERYSFDHLPAESVGFLGVEAIRDGDSPILDLRGGLAGYESRLQVILGRTSKWISKANRNRSKLEERLGPLHFDPDSRSAEMFEAALALKSDQYERTSGWSAFTPWASLVLRRIFETHASNFGGVLSTLRVDDRLIAAHFGMRSDTILHWWFPSYDFSFREFSPGMLLLAEMLSYAPQLGIESIDLGKGDEEYKTRVMTHSVPLFRGSMM